MASSTTAMRWFWLLVAAAVLDMGWLYASWGRPPAPLTGLSVAASGALLPLLVLQAARVAAVVSPRRQRSTDDPTGHHPAGTRAPSVRTGPADR